jgi:putative thioredoxin
MDDHEFIVEVTQANFEEMVIIQSHITPVLVDFWAVWCAPCKILMPIVTRLVTEFAGQFILAKLNIDEQPDLAREFDVRSVPTLKLFYRGEVVEELLGAQPDNVIRDRLSRYVARKSDPFRAQAFELSAQNRHNEAIAAIRQAIEIDPNYEPIQLDLVQLLIAANQFQAAENAIKNLSVATQTDDSMQRILARLEVGKIVAEAPEISILEQQLIENPENLLARYQLSAYQVLQENFQVAMDNLLIIMQKNRKFKEDGARKGLLAIFALLGNDPLVSLYRGKMSRLLY